MRLVDKASASAGQLLATAGGSTLPAASCALAAGATPSLAQCVEGLQDIWYRPRLLLRLHSGAAHLLFESSGSHAQPCEVRGGCRGHLVLLKSCRAGTVLFQPEAQAVSSAHRCAGWLRTRRSHLQRQLTGPLWWLRWTAWAWHEPLRRV